ncbi:MAG: diguanylate cyclase [Frankiales bacterium]|nr:diguanylate cyclase [Frankiales bacterium]
MTDDDRRWRTAPAGAGAASSRVRAARLAAGLFLLASLTVLLTIGFLPPPVDRSRMLVTSAVCAVTAVVLVLLPWRRLPQRATVLPLLWAYLCIGGLVGAYAGQLSHYLPFYGLAALYAGLTQRPRYPLVLAPVTLASPLLALAGAEKTDHLVDLLGAALLSVVVGEVLARVVQRSDEASRAAHALLDGVTALHEARTEDAAADILAELASTLLDPDAALVMLTAPSGSTHYYTNRAQRGFDGPLGELVIDTNEVSGIGLAVSEGRALFVPDARDSPLVDQASAARLALASVLFVPVPGDNGYLGCLVIGWQTRKAAVDPFGEQVVGVLSTQAGAVLQRLRSVGRLRVQATTDPLTGLANRRVFLDAMDRLRPGGAVIFIDLDHFKRLNDSQGHAAGDEVLGAFGAALRASVRDGDCAARYGGEEFALVLPSAASVDMTHAARVVVDRLRARWTGPVTFSVGIATHQAGDPPSVTLARADDAVYEAKARGRNTLVVAPVALPALDHA